MIDLVNPLVSIIVPIYNSEEYLSKCVDSLVAQTYKNIQIVLINDGSPDNSEKICEEYANCDSRVTYIKKDNGGVSDARNYGLKYSKGEIIAFVDPDDWIELETIEVLVKTMLKDGSDIVSYGVKYVDENGDLIRTVAVKENECLSTYEAMREFLKYNKIKQQVWDKIYRKEIIGNIEFEKGRSIEDVFWVHQVLGEAKKISVNKTLLYNYMQRSDSVMGMGYSKKWIDILDALRLRCDYIQGRFPGLYDNVISLYINTCMYHTQLALNSKEDMNYIKDNILSRLSFKKQGDIYKPVNLKKKIWLFCFVHFPIATCKFRNKLGRGI